MSKLIRVDFDDDDSVFTPFNGGIDEVLDYYFTSTFTVGRQIGGLRRPRYIEYSREAIAVTFFGPQGPQVVSTRGLYLNASQPLGV